MIGQTPGSTAPTCTYPGCHNKTWNPGGVCHLHLGKPVPGDLPGRLTGLNEPTLSDGPQSVYTKETISEGVTKAFPDISEVTPDSIREQVVGVLRSAVSVDVFRAFPSHDVDDPRKRYSGLMAYRERLTHNLAVIPNTVSDRDAEILQSSSQDQFGRGIEDSAGLASYGLRKEWELAGLTGQVADRNGTPYAVPFTDFCARVSPWLRAEITDEVDRQLFRYHRVVTEATGYRARNGAPAVQGGDYVPLTPEQIQAEEAQRSRAATAEKVATGVSILTSIAKAGVRKINNAADAARARDEAQVRRASARATAWQEYRATQQQEADRKADEKRQREQDELRKLQLREARARARRW